MKHENVHGFFHNVSRLTIILPIIIIALGIILKPTNEQSPQVQSGAYRAPPLISPTEPIDQTPPGVPINLTGPLVCMFDPQSGYTGTMYIKNKNIYATVLPQDEVATASVLLKDDCVYKWQTGSTTGVKICSISQYVNIISMLSNFKMLDANTIMTVITQFGQANGAQNIPKNVPPPTCQTEAIADSIFTLPKSVRFQLKSTPVPSPTIR